MKYHCTMSGTANIAGVKVGAGYPVRLMGVINVSPESFFKGSVKTKQTIQKAAKDMQAQGADFIDIGAMSTAPYLNTQISENEEANRLSWAVKAVKQVARIPVSIDTSRTRPALAGLKAGADILNDITGLANDPNLTKAAKRAKGLILMAHPLNSVGHAKIPIKTTFDTLKKCFQKAVKSGVAKNRIILDPGIGFFRNAPLPWWKWDIQILKNLSELKKLPAPILVGVSRKSFIGELLGKRDVNDRLHGSLGATVVAVSHGASIIRTHDIKATMDAIRIAEALGTGFRSY